MSCNPVTLTKKVSEQRWFGVSFANIPERLAGETLSNPELIPSTPDGPTFTNLAVNSAAFSGVAIGSAVVFFVAGGDIGDVCDFAVRVTLSGGGKPVIPCRLIVTKDYGLTQSSDPESSICDEFTPGITNDQLIDAALSPLRMKSDNQEVDERPIGELIELDKYLKGKQVSDTNKGNPFAGLKFGIAVPPGTRGRQ